MRIYAQSQQTNPTYKGLYKYIGTLEKKYGRSSINKKVISMHKFNYYPFENETADTIKKAVDKYTIGRSFSLWEKDHGHVEGTYYVFNQIFVKDAVNEKDKERYRELDCYEHPIGGVTDYDDFISTYNNFAYGTMDVTEYNKEAVDKLLKSEIIA